MTLIINKKANEKINKKERGLRIEIQWHNLRKCSDDLNIFFISNNFSN